jgi:hypothetical protein
MARTGQAIEDVVALLELVDALLRTHLTCTSVDEQECLEAIAIELGLPGFEKRPIEADLSVEMPDLPYKCLRCEVQQHADGKCGNCGRFTVVENPTYAGNR